jgi:quercetin dioxygenase-like cupin family protein
MVSSDPNPIGGTATLDREMEEDMPVKATVIGAGKRPTRRGPAETFCGVVFQELLITANAPSRLGGLLDTFAPGARTAWHSHPVGETLYCLSGSGRIGFRGEPTRALHPGDVVNIPPGTPHWHGATANQLFVHLALSELGEKGEGTVWREHVSDAEYHAPVVDKMHSRSAAATSQGMLKTDRDNT